MTTMVRGGGRERSALSLLGLGVLLGVAAGCADSGAGANAQVSQGAGLPGGFVFISGDDADDSGHCQGTRCGGLYVRAIREAVVGSRSGGTGIVAIGQNSGNARASLDGWNSTAIGGPGAPITWLTSTAQVAAANFADYAAVYVPSSSNNTSGGITSALELALNARRADLTRFVNEQGGSLVVLTQQGLSGAFGFLPVPLTQVSTSYTDVTVTTALTDFSPLTNSTNLDHSAYHNVFTGPAGFSGLQVLAWRTGFINTQAAILGGRGTILTAEVCDNRNDDDGDGLIDRDDPECRRCGDGVTDPGEQCDDGNTADGDGCSARCEIVVTNNPPTANAGTDQTFTCLAPGATVNVTLDGSGSSDPDGHALSYDWSIGGSSVATGVGPTLSLTAFSGTNTYTLSVDDGHGGTATDTVDINLSVDTTAPTVTPNAGPSSVECGGSYADPGATATDACTPSLAVSTTGAVDPATVGSYTLSYSATDAAGNTGTASRTVAVVDTTAPTYTARPPVAIWPPAHDLRTFAISDCVESVTDTCGGALSADAAGEVVGISSDEVEDARGGGDGATRGDMVIVDRNHFQVRAERLGSSNGRVYTVALRFTDAAGNVTNGTCQIAVPHDDSGRAAVDDGAGAGYSIP